MHRAHFAGGAHTADSGAAVDADAAVRVQVRYQERRGYMTRKVL